MKKVPKILIAIGIIIIVAFFLWFFFLRNPNIPVGETVRGILPFGSSGEDLSPQSPANGEDFLIGGGVGIIFDEFSLPASELFLISNTPVAGAVVFEEDNEPVVRYIERATGHVYDVMLPGVSSTSTMVKKERITNTTLPKIYEAYFRFDGDSILLRSLSDNSDEIENVSVTLTPPQPMSPIVSTSSVPGNVEKDPSLYNVSYTPLDGDIGSVAVGSENNLFYNLRNVSSIVTSTFNGTGLRTLLRSPFTDWQLSSAGNNLIVHTKASAGASGYAYRVNTVNGALTKIIGPLNGLTMTPSVLGSRVVYSYVENGAIKTFAKNSQNDEPIEILPATLSEKCVWSQEEAGLLFCAIPINRISGGEPDNWYRGLTHFSDRLWLFDTNSGTEEILTDPVKNLGVNIDIIEPKLSPDEDYLIFINKTDLSLWVLKLNQP